MPMIKMLQDNKAYIKIMAEYQNKRNFAEDKRIKEIDRVYKLLPKIKEIDKQITAVGLDNMGKIIRDTKNAEKYKAELKIKLDELNAEKKQILSENNIDENFDKPKYFCEHCSDTGYIDGEKCICLKQQLIDYAYNLSNMKVLIGKQSFEDFDFSFYRDIKIKGKDMTERENIEDIVNISLNFCKNPKESRNLLFYGEPGLGKTFLSSCVAKQMLDSGYTVIYSGASKLFAMYDDYRFGRMTDSSDFEETLKLLYDADLLIIDDLGVEMHGPSANQFFFDLVNDRILNNKRMIISTNLTMPQISKAYTTRITSRLYENFHCLPFYGDDIRTQKLVRAGKRKLTKIEK